MTRQIISCDCGNVIECVQEDRANKPRYRSVTGDVRLRCNDCGKEHSVFLKYRTAKIIGATLCFKRIESA